MSQRYITVFAEQGQLDWQFHISESAAELLDLDAMLKARGIKRRNSYKLGDAISPMEGKA